MKIHIHRGGGYTYCGLSGPVKVIEENFYRLYPLVDCEDCIAARKNIVTAVVNDSMKNVKLVILFFALLCLVLGLTGCLTLSVLQPYQKQKMEKSVYYQNDLCFSVDNKDFCGVGVLPEKSSYDIKIKAPSQIDFLAMNSCHRQATSEIASDGIKLKKNRAQLKYEPTLEKGRACPLFVGAFNKKGFNSKGIIVFEHVDYKLKGLVECNGDNSSYTGVGICQSLKGLLQRISFTEEVAQLRPVNGSSSKADCPVLKTKDKKTFTFKLPLTECIYGFIGVTSRQIFKFHTVGYEQFITRN